MDALTVREAPPADATDPPGGVDGEAAALMTLLRLPGVGDRTVARLVDHFGSGLEALEAGSRDFAALAGDGPARRRDDVGLRRSVERGIAWCRRTGTAVRIRGRPGYPGSLEELSDPPAVVLLRGREELLARPALCVVGSRRSTAAGRRTAGELAGAMAGAGVVVTSGLALGIDAAAHRAALEADGATVAVLGTGPDVAHPPSNRGLFRRMAEDGLLVTEFLPGEQALPHHFPRRNRLLAALTRGVVVVEAGRRSGALLTVGHALDLGRPVGAVPGSIYAPGSAGSNALIRDGALPVLEPADALALLGDGLLLQAAEVAPPGPVPEGDAGRVWRELTELPRSLDELAAAAGLSTARLLAALSELELDGRLERAAGGRFRRSG